MRHLLAALLLFWLALPAVAQDLATLVADQLRIEGDSTLIAEGAVEVLYQGTRLRAARISYDRTADLLQIEGPIVLTDASGTLVLADSAQLSGDLTEGMLQSARVVLEQQLQLAAAEMLRVGGRYTALDRVTASSCKVCGSDVPLWEIRARRVVLDDLERQIYFDHAQFRIGGLPVFYIPRLRMPDPRLKRARGFLVASVRNTSRLGTGIKLPYFIPLGDERDLTLTPYVSTRDMRTLELRYRQTFRTGWIEANGAVSTDQLMPDDLRGYMFADGSFALPRDFALTFRIETASDDAYLRDYGISTQDRLDSRLEVTRTETDEFISLRGIRFYSIREGEDNAIIPSGVLDGTWTRRFAPPVLGGIAALTLQGHSHQRTSSSLEDSDGDGNPDGRDMRRASVIADWHRDWVLPGGVLATAMLAGRADIYRIFQDPVFAGTESRLFGAAGAELRWPLVKTGKGGARQVLEPTLQLVFSPDSSTDLPNEDSLLPEFDQGNLFALNRFPGSDAVEEGVRANLGVSWTRYDPSGWMFGLTMGRVFRLEDLDQFTPSSGLAGSNSDWLAGFALSLGQGFSLQQRTLFDTGLSVTKSETLLSWTTDRFDLNSGYVWVIADSEVDSPEAISEVSLDGRWQITEGWTGRADTRFDFTASRASSAGLGLEFRNECLLVDLSLSRSFASSTSVRPDTEFGLSVDLLGFGGSAGAGPARQCRG